MTFLKRSAFIVLIMVLPFSAVGAEKSKPVPKEKPKKTASLIPSYKPPLRGAPAGRIGGGTRGTSERESFTLQVLAPDHVGNTVNDQPCLYWYISKSTDYPIELTVTERRAVKPLLEEQMSILDSGGIQHVCLNDYDVKLRQDTQYKWFVTLVVDPESRSRDILAGGMLEVIKEPQALLEKLKSVDEGSVPNIYASEGLWYDAIDSVSRLINDSPGNIEYRQWRSALLQQVNLAEVAAYDNAMTQ